MSISTLVPTQVRQGSELVLDCITKSYGQNAAVSGVNLRVEPHEFVTLLGPSGSGKTTLLRMIGGFIAPNEGRILIDGADVAGVPVERRPTAMLFQQLSLWPHMTVARNVSFGLELRRRPKQEIAKRVAELLAVVGLADFGQRLPAQLSGGQQQRVALARALALEPHILLLDEPFSALDTKLRVELRTFVRNLQRELGTTTLLVTHDQEEALELSDRVVVLREGRIEQLGDPNEIYDSPSNAFVAEFLGSMNFLAGGLRDGAAVLGGGVTVRVLQPPEHPFAPVHLGVRPEDVLVEAGGGEFAVEVVTPKGHFKELKLRCGAQALRAYVGRDLRAVAGDRVTVRFRRLHLFPLGPAGEGDAAASDLDRAADRWPGDAAQTPSSPGAQI
ncbi:MAG: ABC transporter ATP-binding protein [Acidimicrobiales bacterium]